MNKLNELILELEKEGVEKIEAEELTLLSKNLSNLTNFERSYETKIKFLNKKNSIKSKIFSFRNPLMATFIAMFLFVGFATIVSAQDSLPGQPLYRVKRLSENVLSTLNPSFKGEVLTRRSNEIKLLSNPKDSNSDKLLKTIKDYENELNEKGKFSKAQIEQSRINLEQARKVASDGSKMEIEHVLRQTENEQFRNITPTVYPGHEKDGSSTNDREEEFR